MIYVLLVCALLLSATSAKGEEADLERFWQDLRRSYDTLCVGHVEVVCRDNAMKLLGFAGEIFSIKEHRKVRSDPQFTEVEKKRIAEISEQYRTYRAKWRPEKL